MYKRDILVPAPLLRVLGLNLLRLMKGTRASSASGSGVQLVLRHESEVDGPASL